VYHDEDCEVYINGVLAASASGYVTSYVVLPMNAAGQNALIANGTNLIAVHCHQTTGGQDIDVGISRMNIVMNALVVPTDYLNYWALDEGSGTTAYDSSGNGNNGTLSNAAWDANGKIKGCLAFNGVKSYVSMNNSLSNDFSISFWVQTTQTGALGQWWQGNGLVDGFVAANTNDFGTSLSGGHFALGVGNPDTTIVSTVPINDGGWHQCVATRTMATGTLELYVDGVWQATGTGNTNSLSSATSLRMGCRQTGGNYFQGNLDDVRIYSRALGSNEVTALYEDSCAPAAAPATLAAAAGNNQVMLNWAEVPVATGYDLKRSTTQGGPYASIASLYGSTYTDYTATNGTTYYYVAAAENSLGDGTNSPESSATPSLAVSVMTWFKADAISGLASGAAISDWADLSGNGDDAIQTNASQQPIYVARSLNGLPVVHFNAAASNYLAFARPVQDDFTIFCVFRSSQGSGSGTAFFQGAGLVNGEVAGVMDDFGTSLNSGGEILAGTGNPDTTAVSGAGYNDGQPHEFTFKRTASTGAITLYVDGTLSATNTGGTQSLTSPQQLVLGAQQTLLSYLTGDIAEVKIYDSALADNDRIAEEDNLIYKWGIRQLPSLGWTNANSQSLTVNWPAGSGGWGLLFATSLIPPVAWLPVTNALGSNSGRFYVTIPFSGSERFFRLATP
jgi:hypothetical protein